MFFYVLHYLKFSVIAAIIKKDHNDPYAYYIRRCTGISDAAGLQQDRSLCPGSSVKGDQNDEGRTRIAKSIATLVSLAVLFAIVSGLVSMLIPQIYESIIGFQDSLTEYINNLTVWISKLLQDNEHLQESIMPYYNEAVMRSRLDRYGSGAKYFPDL